MLSRVLVTSQAPLALSGEEVVRLEPLELPSLSDRDVDALAAVPSVALLLDRVRASGSPFALTAENAGDIAELCRRLEGMPLAVRVWPCPSPPGQPR